MLTFQQNTTKRRLIQKLFDLIRIFFHQTISTIGRHLQKKLEPNPRPSPKILIFRQGICLKIFLGSKIFFSNSDIFHSKSLFGMPKVVNRWNQSNSALKSHAKIFRNLKKTRFLLYSTEDFLGFLQVLEVKNIFPIFSRVQALKQCTTIYFDGHFQNSYFSIFMEVDAWPN